MFDYEGYDVINAMSYLMVRVSEHLEIISEIYVDKMIEYIEYILRVAVLKKYIHVLAECN